MLTSRAAMFPLVLIALALLISAGCESVPNQAPYPAIQAGLCEPAEEMEDDCVQPLDMTVEVHE